jgi:hypothetical protein
MPRRAPETLADYMVVAISPALVMLMVGSLLWFLTIVFYKGDYPWRLLFVHAMFIMGTVCITRIAMEEGAAYASWFAIPLAIVVAIGYIRFVDIRGPLAPLSTYINLGLEALIWFSAHKLTWDCTLIDERQDSSKEGLLQSLGWDRVEGEFSPPAATHANGNLQSERDQDPHATTGATPEERVAGWLQSWLAADPRPHTPGVWIIYFSLAALPLFGIGQWFIPPELVELRRNAFWLLVVYVATGLLLLLNTSFLGLRRYLRQRNLPMPTEMAATWLGVGAAMVLAILLFVWLLPRTSLEYSVTDLEIFKSKPVDPSRWGWGDEGSKHSSDSETQASGSGGQNQKQARSTQENDSEQSSSGQGKSKQEGGTSGKQGPGKSQSDSAEGKSSGGKRAGKEQGSDGQKGNEAGGDGKKGEKSDGQSKSPQPDRPSGKSQPQERQSGGSPGRRSQESNSSRQDSPSDSSRPNSLRPQSQPLNPLQWLSHISPAFGQILRWLFWIAVVVALAVAAWVYRNELRAAWQKLLAELRALWARWFAGRPAEAPSIEVPPLAPPRPFAAYADPFASGLAGRASIAELVRYTFEALEAWGREHQSPRTVGQTVHEYARQVGQVHKPLAGEARFLAELYGQLAYARSVPQANLDPLRRLWLKMQGTKGA